MRNYSTCSNDMCVSTAVLADCLFAVVVVIIIVLFLIHNGHVPIAYIQFEKALQLLRAKCVLSL